MAVEQILQYYRANGISAVPKQGEAPYTPVEGYVPQQYLFWQVSGVPDLAQNIQLIEGLSQEQKNIALFEVQAFYGKPQVETVKWKDVVSPPPPAPPPANATIGPPVPGKPNCYTNNSAKTYPDGTVVIVDGVEYIFRQPTPFSCYWEKAS